MAVIKSGSTTDQAFVTPANALKVDGSGVTQPVSISGTVTTDDVSSSTIGAAAPAQAIQIGLNKSGSLVAATADANNNLNVNIQDVGGSAATTKGVQPAAAIPTQDLKDSGRVIKILQATFTPATAEALVSLTPVVDGAVGTAGTSFGVTAGKRFRVQAIMLSVENTTAAIRGTQVIVRMSTSGAVTVSSPVIGGVAATTAAATLQLAASQAQSFPDGIELSGTMQIGISAIGTALAGSTVSLIGYEY
jgi:hypothetical protein